MYIYRKENAPFFAGTTVSSMAIFSPAASLTRKERDCVWESVLSRFAPEREKGELCGQWRLEEEILLSGNLDLR